MLKLSVLYPLVLCIPILGILARKRKRPTFPPGPKGYPILGNVLDLPMSVPIWETFASLADIHGTDILYLQLMGNDTVVLNSNKAISDLLEKRSSIYSDRPESTMANLTGMTDWAFSLMPSGDRWGARRRLFHEVMNGRLTRNFDSHHLKYVHRFLSRLLEEPESFMRETEFIPGAIIMSITYGIDIESADNPFLSANLEATKGLATALVPGKFLVDTIPILQYLPYWFPGTGFKVLAKEVREKYQISLDGPMEYVKKAMKSGEGFSDSITSDCLSRLEDLGETSFSEEVIRDVSGIMFTGAADTTKAVLQTFFLVMALNPGVAEKAQEELDRVVGKDRLPEFSDRDDLPYIDAVVKELLRWGSPAPISIPVKTTQDDIYRGYSIPAGTTVIENTWAVCRDPNIYPDPEAFNPDRFLKDGEINPLVFNPEDRVFGSGRRACPGRRFALRTLYIVIACVPSVFDIEPALDEDGNPQPPKAEFTSRVLREPKPFKCAIKPRSEGSVKLVKEACDVSNY